jgi:hypothetical protein
MNPPLEPQPRQRRYSIRYQARLEAETMTTLEELAGTFHRKRGQILRHPTFRMSLRNLSYF